MPAAVREVCGIAGFSVDDSDALDDAHVGLVDEEDVDVVDGKARDAADFANGGGHPRHRLFEDRAPFHDRNRIAGLDLLRVHVGPVTKADAGYVKRFDVRAVRVKARGQEAAIAVIRAFDHHRARPVAEEHGAVPILRIQGSLGFRDFAILEADGDVPAVLPRHERGMDIGPDQEQPLVFATADQRIREVQPVQKAGALLADVERRDIAEPHLGLHDRAIAWEEVVGGHRGEDQRVDVARAATRGCKGGLRGNHPQVG